MKKFTGFILFFVLGVFTTAAYAYEAQLGPAGLLKYEQAKTYGGYTMFAPNFSKTTYLIDMQGNLVHKWDSEYNPGLHAMLLPNGNLLRGARLPNPPCTIGGAAGLLQELDWDGKVVWEYKMMDDTIISHHTFDRLPNGNTIILAWERKTNDEMKARGRTRDLIPAEGVNIGGKIHRDFWVDFIREVNPKGETVWEWHVWDHMGTGPDQIDPNYTLPAPVGLAYQTVDWTHYNTCFYDAKNDRIVTNSRNFGEVYVIDHKTGKIVSRWGNPSAFGQGKAPSYFDNGDQILFGSHDASMEENGNILVFNNGSEAPERRVSSIIEFNPVDGKIAWKYAPVVTHGFFSNRQGAVQKLPNGNYLVTSSNMGHLFEVTPEKEVVWEYVSPVITDGKVVPVIIDTLHARQGGLDILTNYIHRSYRYGPDYAGLKGRDLSKKLPFTEGAPNWLELLQTGANK